MSHETSWLKGKTGGRGRVCSGHGRYSGASWVMAESEIKIPTKHEMPSFPPRGREKKWEKKE